MPPRHYIFSHFPKTGGTSLLAVCRANLDPADISPHLDEAEIRLLPAASFEHYRLIRGHFSLRLQMGFCRHRYSMTILREPLRRIFSSYAFWRTLPDLTDMTSAAKQLPFSDFVRYFKDSPAVVLNPYTHYFAAISRDYPGYAADAQALLSAAKDNLAAFNFIGICEEFERSAHLLCSELGWRAPAEMPFENRTMSGDRFDRIDHATKQILRDSNQLDLELYEYAVEIFHARAAASAPPLEANRFVPFLLPHHANRSAMIQSVSAEWDPNESSRRLAIGVLFRTCAPLPELSVGVEVSDAAGHIVWGANTAHECLRLDCAAGGSSQATFVVECALPRGMYFVAAALSEPRRLGYHHHWVDRASFFTVDPPRASRSRYQQGLQLREFWSAAGNGDYSG
ncbi:MAG TPA: Wzt carbohydrate-binding domain-containing protein [Bryobacteraceae bacterium]|nr:Wzt carbohydrate-binding domain-containing protein [Bryobacteraceae bacterium]